MGCLVAVVSCSRVVGSATVYIMLFYAVGSLVFCGLCSGCGLLVLDCMCYQVVFVSV